MSDLGTGKRVELVDFNQLIAPAVNVVREWAAVFVEEPTYPTGDAAPQPVGTSG